MIKNQNNTVQALWIGVGSFTTFAVSLVSTAVLSRYLDKTEYGTYRQILYVYNSLLIVFTAGLPRVFNYFLPRYGLEKGKEIVFKITRVLSMTGLAFSVFLFFTSDLIATILRNPELGRGLKYFSPVPALLLPTMGIDGIFTTYRKTIYIAIYQILSRTLMFIFITVPVILFDRSYITAIYGWICVSVIILVLAWYFKGIPFKGIEAEKSGLGFKEILNYSLPLVSASIAGIIYRSANQFFISRYYGPEAFAEFSNGFLELPFVSMITGATSGVLMPLFSRIIHEKSDISQITTLWRSALRKSAVLIYPLVIFFLFYSTNIITIVYSEKYVASAKYFTVALILNFFNIIIFAPLLLSMGETKYYARIHYFLAAVTWIVQYLMVIIFKSPLAIAIAFVLIGISGINISIWYVSKKIKVSFFELFPLKQFIFIAAHSCISLLPVYLLLKYVFPGMGSLLTLILAFTGYLCILLISSRWVKINYLEIVLPLIKKNK